MKKVLAIFAIVALASCGDGTSSTDSVVDSVAVQADTVVIESVDSVATVDTSSVK